jgi:imidazolonepropionase-like amidohydrolase
MNRTIAAWTLGAALWAGVHAQGLHVYAIAGARIVPGNGPTIDRGTIVMRDGLIDLVGASVNVPADAEVIDGRGMTVYPGLIDLGNTTFTAEPARQPPDNAKTHEEVERWKRGQVLHPGLRAADVYKADPADLAQLVSAGITTLLVLPPGEVVSGQSALVDITAPEEASAGPAGSPLGTVVVERAVALHVGFPVRPQGPGYPTSLMGVIAFVRQAFLDAQYASASRGVSPGKGAASDPSLEGLHAALHGSQPVVLRADLAREIRRVLGFASEFNLHAIVEGAHEAAATIADLKAANASVIYSLNYPTRPSSLAPDADEPIRALRLRASIPRGPAALDAAGVLFAFESAGLQDSREFVRNAARAVEAGLAEPAALKALTIDAARIAGVADRIGSLEKGKIANVIVADGDLFRRQTIVARVFVEGRPVTLAAVRHVPARK